MNDNNIGEKGIKQLVPALKEMKGLSKLGLSNNNIGEKGIEHLVPAIKFMTALDTLTLYDNAFTGIGADKIRQAWQQAGKAPNNLSF